MNIEVNLVMYQKILDLDLEILKLLSGFQVRTQNFTFSCLPVNQSGCSSVCPSHNNYKHVTKFRSRIKHVLVTKGDNSIKKQSWRCGSHYLHII